MLDTLIGLTGSKGKENERRFVPNLISFLDKESDYLQMSSMPASERTQEAYILRGHAYFKLGSMFASEESYINALRLRPRLKEASVHERLGMVYAERKSWDDAKTVFMKCCRSTNTMNSWLHLGVSLLRLREFEHAEDAFTEAIRMDDCNPDSWAYLCLLCLDEHNALGSRVAEAINAAEEAFRHGIEHVGILEEMATKFAAQGQPEMAEQCLQRALEEQPENGDLYALYGETLVGMERDEEGVDMLRRALEFLEGENARAKTAGVLRETLKKMGQEEEANEVEEQFMAQA